MKFAIGIGLAGIVLFGSAGFAAASVDEGPAASPPAEAPQGSRLTSGYNRGFFIEDEEGRFRLRLNAEGQIRYIGNNVSEVEGFQLRRTRFDIRGHIFDPRLGYRIRAGFGPGDDFSVEHAYLSYGENAAVVQAGVRLAPAAELFGRYETLDLGGLYYRASTGGLQGGSGAVFDERRHLVTAGLNYYIHADQLKWTVDVIRALDGLPVSNSGNGLGASAGPQTAVRGQVQWRF